MANPNTYQYHSIGGTGARTDFNAFFGTSAADRIKKKWSPEVYRMGMDALMWSPFLSMKNYFGKNEGESVTVGVNFWDRSLTGLGTLDTNQIHDGLERTNAIAFGTRSQQHFTATLREHGFAYDHKKFDDMFLVQDQMPEIFEELAFNGAYNADAKAAQVFKYAYSAIRTTGSGTLGTLLQRLNGTLRNTTGTASGADADLTAGTGKLTPDNVLKIQTMMRQSLIPTFPGNEYFMIGDGDFFTGLKTSALWQDVQLYNNAGAAIMNNQVGKMWSVRFFETNELTEPNVGYIFGPGVGIQSWSVAMQLLIESDLEQDFGRKSGAAWYFGNAVAPALRDFYFEGRLDDLNRAAISGSGDASYASNGRLLRETTGHLVKIFTGALPDNP